MIGTEIRLASGGPVMLICDYEPRTAKVLCSWPSSVGKIEEAWFPIICLDVVRGKTLIIDDSWVLR